MATLDNLNFGLVAHHFVELENYCKIKTLLELNMFIYNNLIPSELITNISSHLKLTSLLNAASTCKAWHQLLNEDNTNVNDIWKKFLNTIFTGNVPKDDTFKSFFIKNTLDFIKEKNLDSGYLKAGYAHLMLSRLGLSTIDLAMECANVLEINSFQRLILNHNIALECIKNDNIKLAKKICRSTPRSSKRYGMALEIIKYYIKINQLQNAFNAFKYIHHRLYLNKALILLTWNSAQANQPELSLKVINYVIGYHSSQRNAIQPQQKIEDLKNITKRSAIGVCARYIYNFFITKNENALIEDRYRSQYDVRFYIENDRFFEAEKVALSCEKPQDQYNCLQAIFLEHKKRGNFIETERISDLIFSTLKKSHT